MVATLAKNNLRDDEEYITLFGIKTCDDNDFDEDKHPRKENGQFAKTKGSKETKNDNESKKENKTEKSNASEVETNKKVEYSFSKKNSNKSQERKQKEIKKENIENEESEEEPVINKIKNMSATCKKYDNMCKDKKIEHREVRKLKKQLSSEEIVKKIGGLDNTKGSCASVAYAYIANKYGLDVNDFRGDDGLDIFGNKEFLSDMIYTNRYKKYIEVSDTEVETAEKIIDKLDKNKEYLCSFGQHATIVRKTDSDIQYLELQGGESKNGWKSFYELDGIKYDNIDTTLHDRFGAKYYRTVQDQSRYTTLIAVEIEQFKDNLEFQHLLGYINTAEDKQKKIKNRFHTSNKIDLNNLYGSGSGITIL